MWPRRHCGADCAEAFGADASWHGSVARSNCILPQDPRSAPPNLRSGMPSICLSRTTAFDVVTNIESSHTYPNLRGFFTEVRRVLRSGGRFLYTDLLPASGGWRSARCLALVFESRRKGISPPMFWHRATKSPRQELKRSAASDGMIDNFLGGPGVSGLRADEFRGLGVPDVRPRCKAIRRMYERR